MRDFRGWTGLVGALCLICAGPAQAGSFMPGSYTGRLTPEAADTASTPRSLSIEASGSRFAHLKISRGEIGCETNATPHRRFTVALGGLSRFPNFGRGHFPYPLSVLYTQTTPLSPTGPWTNSSLVTPPAPAGQVELVGSPRGRSIKVHLSISYVADLEGRPTTNPDTGSEPETSENIARDSHCNLDQRGTLRLVTAPARRAQAAARPTRPSTVFQCKKRYRAGAQRAACIKRVTAKRGSSCAKPLFSGQAVDGGTIQGSDTKDYVVNVRELGPVRNPGTPEPIGLQMEVDVKNPRIEICRAIIITYPPDRVTGTSEPLKKTDHIVHIPPHGGSSETITVPGDDAWGGIVYARLK